MPHGVAVPPYFLTVRCAAGNPPSKRTNAKSKKTRTQKIGGASSVGFGPRWQCVEGCGACCKLDKGPSFATPEEIFENPSDIEMLLVTSRRCRVYSFDLCLDSRILWLKSFTHTRNVPTDFVQLLYVIRVHYSYWREDRFPHGAGFDTSEPLYGSGFMDKAEEAYLGEVHHGNSNYSYDNDVEMQPGFDYISWFGDEYGSEEDFRDHGDIGVGWDEKKLCESIFGYWPCLLEQNLESYVEERLDSDLSTPMSYF
ncbi:hypothetical protein C3L33_12449, partial [Rhododendron williamsianum]